jgi:diguanylate cyclase (GGDEF)-like protein
MLDIDRFKSINDTYSHLCGDEVLRRVAVVLTRSLREEDLVARLGGEEFGVLLQCSAPRAEALMERLRREVAAIRPEWENQEIPVTISIGLASSEFLGHNLQYLYAAADAALYQAKTEGRNTVRRAHRLVERRSDAGALPEG